ncbi:MAG: transglycosylase domain-containing protein [Acetobacteraceae bacterium]
MTVIAALFIAGGLAVALELLTTPTAAEAVALVRAEARRHGTAYPGPEPPQRFVAALIATEDQRFYSPLDPGIDPFAVGRVILGRMTGRRDQGGSTIEQQLAKMLYTPRRTGLMVELEQMALAIKLNFTYPKSEILSMYAEVAYFGHGHYGLWSASCGYFGREPAELSWAQAAMLAGVVNAPTALDPRTHPRSAHEREAHVFARLVAVGDLAQGQADAALARPLGLVPMGRPVKRPMERTDGASSCTARGRS